MAKYLPRQQTPLRTCPRLIHSCAPDAEANSFLPLPNTGGTNTSDREVHAPRAKMWALVSPALLYRAGRMVPRCAIECPYLVVAPASQPFAIARNRSR